MFKYDSRWYVNAGCGIQRTVAHSDFDLRGNTRSHRLTAVYEDRGVSLGKASQSRYGLSARSDGNKLCVFAVMWAMSEVAL
jgi:hypothetical protein